MSGFFELSNSPVWAKNRRRPPIHHHSSKGHNNTLVSAALLKQSGTNIRPTSWYQQPSWSKSSLRCNVRKCVLLKHISEGPAFNIDGAWRMFWSWSDEERKVHAVFCIFGACQVACPPSPPFLDLPFSLFLHQSHNFNWNVGIYPVPGFSTLLVSHLNPLWTHYPLSSLSHVIKCRSSFTPSPPPHCFFCLFPCSRFIVKPIFWSSPT